MKLNGGLFSIFSKKPIYKAEDRIDMFSYLRLHDQEVSNLKPYFKENELKDLNGYLKFKFILLCFSCAAPRSESSVGLSVLEKFFTQDEIQRINQKAKIDWVSKDDEPQFQLSSVFNELVMEEQMVNIDNELKYIFILNFSNIDDGTVKTSILAKFFPCKDLDDKFLNTSNVKLCDVIDELFPKENFCNLDFYQKCISMYRLTSFEEKHRECVRKYVVRFFTEQQINEYVTEKSNSRLRDLLFYCFTVDMKMMENQLNNLSKILVNHLRIKPLKIKTQK